MLPLTLEEIGQAIAKVKSNTNAKCYPVFKKRKVINRLVNTQNDFIRKVTTVS